MYFMYLGGESVEGNPAPYNELAPLPPMPGAGLPDTPSRIADKDEPNKTPGSQMRRKVGKQPLGLLYVQGLALAMDLSRKGDMFRVAEGVEIPLNGTSVIQEIFGALESRLSVGHLSKGIPDR